MHLSIESLYLHIGKNPLISDKVQSINQTKRAPCKLPWLKVTCMIEKFHLIENLTLLRIENKKFWFCYSCFKNKEKNGINLKKSVCKPDNMLVNIPEGAIIICFLSLLDRREKRQYEVYTCCTDKICAV